MSFLAGSAKKCQFYVEFLGWMECRGLRGPKYAEPIVREFRRRQRKVDTPPRLTIQVSKKNMKITQDVEDKNIRNIKKIKFPTIPASDITYVYQAMVGLGVRDDIVACILLGYMPRTQRYVHVHVYRFDSADTASTFTHQVAQLVQTNDSRVRQIEIDLANKGEIDDPRLNSSDGMSEQYTIGSAYSDDDDDDDTPGFNRRDIDPDLQSLKDVQPFDNVADELKYRLQVRDSPLLLPPKDYDTISRAHGNLELVNRRRCLNMNIVGDITPGPGQDVQEVQEVKVRNGSEESGILDLSSTSSDRNDVDTSSPHHLNNSFSLSESFRSGAPSTSGTTPVDLYPPKLTSPPMSPKIPHGGGEWGGGGVAGAALVRQSSYSSAMSYHSDGSKQSHHSEGEVDDKVHIYKGSMVVNNDIYAMPMKNKPATNITNTNNNYSNNISSSSSNIPNSMTGNDITASSSAYHITSGNVTTVSPRADYPRGDYQGNPAALAAALAAAAGGSYDDIVQMRALPAASSSRFQRPHLTRSMPPDLIRSEMALGSSGNGSQRAIRDSREVAAHLRHSQTPGGGRGGGGFDRVHDPYLGQSRLASSARRINSSYNR